MTQRNPKSVARAVAPVVALLLCAATVYLARHLTLQVRERAAQSERTRFELTIGPADPKEEPAIPVPAHGGEVREIRGRVVDEFGVPISGATVALLDPQVRYAPLDALRAARQVATTGDGGVFDLHPSDDIGDEAMLVARHPLYRPRETEAPRASDAEIEIVLSQGQNITGRVVFAIGEQPAIGVRVVARGVGAAYRCSDPGVFATARSEVQATVSGPCGEFVLSGLADGAHQLDVVEPGLVVVPQTSMSSRGRWHMPSIHSVQVEAGYRDVVVHVLPVACARVRVVDDVTGYGIPGVRCRFWTEHVLPIASSDFGSGNSLLANGRSLGRGSFHLPADTLLDFWVPPTWPLPEGQTVRATVQARGYFDASIRVPILPVGVEDDEAPIVRLKSKQGVPLGGVSFRLRDLNGNSVGQQTVVLKVSQAERRRFLSVHLNGDGASDLLSFPAGRYEYAVMNGVRTSAITDVVSADVRAGQAQELELVLSGVAGFSIEVKDEHSEVLDDVGVRIGPGRQNPIVNKMTDDPETGGVRFTGLFLTTPGAGPMRRRTFIGYEPGVYTLELYRHGYRPQRLIVEMKAGVLEKCDVVMEASSAVRWDSWDRTPPGR